MEELGTIKYGELRFLFFINPEVSRYLQENNIQTDSFMMSSQSFYQAVLFKLGVNHEEKNDLEVVFYSVNSSDGQVNSEVGKEYLKFENFPLGEIMVSFGARVK